MYVLWLVILTVLPVASMSRLSQLLPLTSWFVPSSFVPSYAVIEVAIYLLAFMWLWLGKRWISSTPSLKVCTTSDCGESEVKWLCSLFRLTLDSQSFHVRRNRCWRVCGCRSLRISPDDYTVTSLSDPRPLGWLRYFVVCRHGSGCF